MILGWLKKKFEQQQSYEAERFLVSLEGGDTVVIDMVLGTAMFWAEFYKNKGIDLYSMEEWLLNKPLFPLELNKIIKRLQKQGTEASATGVMVWLFSARALMYPEQRLSGRKIWEQLSRASLLSERIALEQCAAMGMLSPYIRPYRVPNGLENLKID